MCKHRDVSTFLSKFRNFLLGRKHIKAVRFPDEVADRNYETPCYPPTVHEKFSSNGYYMRNGRGTVKRPMSIRPDKKLEDPCGEKLPKPGKVHLWDDHKQYRRR